MFDLLPETDFSQVLAEFQRVLRPGGRLAMVNMTNGERWYNGLWQRIYRIRPALLDTDKRLRHLKMTESTSNSWRQISQMFCRVFLRKLLWTFQYPRKYY